jgi:tRNA (adenine57-N1/adenine58-N1)-methyltransferase
MQSSECIFALNPLSKSLPSIIYENFHNVKSLQLQESRMLTNRYGQFTHESLLSTPLSSKCLDIKGQSYIRCLSVTPELWTKALQMRTQILYRPDISTIIGNLDIKPGSIVVESGTGSGSLSMSIIRALMPSGKLFTFEFNEARALQAKEEFNSLGLGSCVVSEHRDVVSRGLAHEGFKECDAVFLDLPNPWDVVQSAFEVMKKGGTLCTFSPCIEQVQRNCLAMEKTGFSAVRTLETLSRPLFLKNNEGRMCITHDIQEERLHTGYLSFGHK